MSRMWEGDRTSKGGRRAGGDQFPSRQGGLSCGQAPAMHATGAFLVHTGHPVTRQLKDLLHSGGTTILCDWSQALPAPEMSTAQYLERNLDILCTAVHPALATCLSPPLPPWPCPAPGPPSLMPSTQSRPLQLPAGWKGCSDPSRTP